MTVLERAVLYILTVAVVGVGGFMANAILDNRTNVATLTVKVVRLEGDSATTPRELSALTASVNELRTEVIGMRAELSRAQQGGHR